MIYNLIDIRKAKGLTQEQLAEKANISKPTIVKLESGEEVEVKMSTLQALAKALECHVSDFFCI